MPVKTVLNRISVFIGIKQRKSVFYRPPSFIGMRLKKREKYRNSEKYRILKYFSESVETHRKFC